MPILYNRSCEITIRVARPMFNSLNEMCSLATMPLESLVAQIVEASVADYRRRQIPTDFLIPKEKDEPPISAKGATQQKVDAAKAQRILHALDQGISISAIAERNRIGHSTVRRPAAEQ